jgi:Kelch motif
MPGYSPTTTRVALPPGRTDVEADMQLTVAASTCTAAGYAYEYHGAGTGFEGWSAAQDGWQVTDDAGSGKTWMFDDPAGKGNVTGGSGQFAIVDNWYFPVAHDDTSLVSPSVDLSGQSTPVIGFDSYYYDYGFGVQDGEIYLSLDGGATWSDVWHAPDAFVQGHVEIPVPQAAGKSDVKVRFRFSGDFDNYWEIDNAFVGTRTCDPTAGGLVAGVVRDGNTGAPVVGATVSTDGASAVSRTTPDDGQLPDGFYWLYTGQAGRTALSAGASDYGVSQATVSTATGTVVRQDWSLAAGRLTIKPASISVSQRSGDTRYQTVRLTNDGSRSLHLNLIEQNRGFTPAGGKHQSTAAGAPLQRVDVAASWKPFATRKTSPQTLAQPQTAAAGAAWSDLPWYPTPIMDNLVTEDDGVVYSVAAFTDSGITAAAYAYHQDSKSWTRIADLPQRLESPVGGFVDGKLYAAGGWDANGNPVSTTYAYDPRANTWSRVADLPAPIAAAAGTSANGRLYVVAGCTTVECVPASTAAYRYDPDTDAWTRLADYPQPVVLPGCAQAGDGVVCAGGLTPLDTYPYEEPSGASYQYVAGSNAWTRVADMPYPDWGMAYAGADGRLQVVGGVANGSVTNQAVEFDPATGAWSGLPNANNAVYRGGAACGLYRIGGSLPSFSGIEPSPYAEQLPTGDACISGSDVLWLSESSSDIAIPPGRSVTVTIELDASGVSAAGQYDARLAVATDTPYPVLPVTVAMTVKR